MELKKRLNLSNLIPKRPTQDTGADVESSADTPEANAARGVRLFCESGAANSGEEVLHLPTIVEAAVASPTAAAATATQIRRFLSKENYARPHVQYNAVMLIRILADNPGPSFTKNLDKQFADTIKHLLRNGKDPSVAQILRETLDSMEREKAYDTNLNVLFAMWRKEKGLMASAAKEFGPRKLNAPAWNGQAVQGGFSSSGGSGRSKGLPSPQELAGRIEEARTSAKLLLQLVQSTPSNELLGNDLVKEFAERCTTAQRSIHGYIACDNPAPDDDTMLTLIETNEQLSLAASKHQRAILQARKLLGPSPSPPAPQTISSHVPAGVPSPTQVYSPPSLPPPGHTPSQPPITEPGPPSRFGQPSLPNPHKYKNDELPLPPALQAGPPSDRRRESANPPEEDPFADHHTSGYTPPPTSVNPRVNGHAGSPDSYNPGYQSTPSYLGRQDSSANNLTMHGAQQQQHAEGDHYAQQYPPNMSRSQLPGSQPNAPQSPHDVSPIAERNTVTYRY